MRAWHCAWLCAAVTAAAATGAPLLPWQSWIEKPSEAGFRDLESLFDLAWRDSGAESGHMTLGTGLGPWGGRYFDFRITVNHHHPGPYPMAWPSFEVQPDPKLDFTGYDAIQYWIRCETAREGALPIRFILWTDGQNRLQELIPGVKRGEWVQVTHRLTGIPALDKVDRLHFFICEADYNEGDELRFMIGGFRLCRLEKELSRLPADQAAMGLWVGERADTSERIVILERGTPQLPALMVFETGDGLALRATDEVQVRFHEVFSGQETERVMPLGQDVPAGTITRVHTAVDTADLTPGYYLVVADVRRAGQSLLGGRVGSDDLYIRKPDESMTYTVLSVRTGMVLWLRDLLHGDIMGWARASLPHVYDPLNADTYRNFLRLFATVTGKHTEGNEAGCTGLALAAEAFRKAGDMTRCRFAEWLLEDSYRHMIEHMQAPNGGCIMYVDELGGYPHSFGTYDSNQIGEWMRALTYGIIYYTQVPQKREYARYLGTAVRKSADYLVAHAVMESDGIPRVIRHLTLSEEPDGAVRQITYYQEGRQCDVYLGRALAGLSYYAYAMQLLGERVPDDWWEVMDNTVAWCERKMKPNGWFDWQCEDIVEGGCHTFLGNIYVGEGMFGVYLASRVAGREEGARRAAEAARRAYRYVTDDCTIRGVRYGINAAAEFWVGPYVYWLFTEYEDTVGPEEGLHAWLTGLDELWSEKRGWRDFLDRPRDGSAYVGRASENGMLNVAVLAYPAIKLMAQIGQPLHWKVQP